MVSRDNPIVRVHGALEFLRFINLFEREAGQGQGRGKEAHSLLSVELHLRLDLTTLGS